eukprot:TRINITY_DN54636_c0_g1_i1.p1 TRINITY_DN54636_c0_g1~~TRINITY_DN54636_c0_g1_i1.p1  ORF type:complete len:625 (-),score=118.48 TRINITY_DN54636_c0_g1_i1:56-1930(-)
MSDRICNLSAGRRSLLRPRDVLKLIAVAVLCGRGVEAFVTTLSAVPLKGKAVAPAAKAHVAASAPSHAAPSATSKRPATGHAARTAPAAATQEEGKVAASAGKAHARAPARAAPTAPARAAPKAGGKVRSRAAAGVAAASKRSGKIAKHIAAGVRAKAVGSTAGRSGGAGAAGNRTKRRVDFAAAKAAARGGSAKHAGAAGKTSSRDREGASRNASGRRAARRLALSDARKLERGGRGSKPDLGASAGQQMLIRSSFDQHSSHWLDTAGNRIEAHGAGMLYSEPHGRWYWYGESKKGENEEAGINCYSSASLAGPWTFEGRVLSDHNVHVDGWKHPFILERPKVIYNEKTKKYVMWFHVDHKKMPGAAILQTSAVRHKRLKRHARHHHEKQQREDRDGFSINGTMWERLRTGEYILRRVGVATADHPSGPFRLKHTFQPDHIPSLDMSLFVDDDKTAYFIRSCNNAFTGISKLTDDYLNTTGLIAKGPLFEGMALFRHTNGTLYMISSHLTGWAPNPLMLFRADGPSLSDPRWVNLGNPTTSLTSYNSQPTFVVKVKTRRNQTYHMYMADNWIHGGPDGLPSASYVWLPIRFSGNQVHLDRLQSWDMEDPFASLRVARGLRQRK